MRSTHGLMLFGVPNLGLRQEQLKVLVSGQANEILVASLVVDREGEPSSYLKELTQKFIQCSQFQNPAFDVVSYFEEKASPTLQVSSFPLCLQSLTHIPQKRRNESLDKTGPPALLVTEDSAARIGLGDNFHQHLPLNVDHSGLVKFGRGDPNYKRVKHSLEILVTATHRIVSHRFAVKQGVPN